MNDDKAIKQLVQDAQDHQTDVEPFLALHTDETIVVNIAGRRVLGKPALEQAMNTALATPLADVVTTLEVEDIRYVTGDVALVSVGKHVDDRREDAPENALPAKGNMTYVVRREDGAWRIALAQTTPIVTA
ncbi:SgcJ/EcaC family oxidoreductase [Spirillospora sp. CA-294931]|uniref:SgcJ/EcaC family oxidoreductase n=1 Tax=Spirillospora sp. CA-294931 TaxID=3240042 RepID=UPI003D8BDD63